MKKTLIGFAVLILIVAIVAVGGPGLVGRNAKQALENTLDAMSMPGLYRIELTDYKSGWFTSRATSTFVLEGELAQAYDEAMGAQGMPADTFTLTFQHNLRHGPLLMTDAGPKVALAYAETEMNLPPLYMFLLSSYLKGKGLFSFETTFGFGGGSVTHISNPAYSDTMDDGTTIRWDGIDGVLIADGQNIKYDIEAPKLRFESHDTMSSIDGMKYAGEQSRYGQHLWIGNADFTVPQMRFKSGETGDVSVDSLSYTTSSEVNDGGRLDYTGEIRIAGLTAPDIKLGENAWTFDMKNLPPEALDTAMGMYQDALRNLGNEQAMQAALDRLFNEALEPIFEGPVEMNMGLLVDLAADEGTLKGNANIRIAGQDGKVEVSVNQTADDVRIDPIILTDSVASLTLSGLEGSVLADIYRGMTAIMTSDKPEWQQSDEIEALIATELPAMLGPQTRLSLDNLALNVPDGTAVATGALELTGDAPVDLSDDDNLMRRLKGKFSATISEGAMLWAISRDSVDAIRASLEASGREVSKETVEQLAQTAARSRVSALVGQSVLRRMDDDYVIEATFDNGMLTLNGVPRPDLLAP